jgi:cyanophycinase-like exopeptidase
MQNEYDIKAPEGVDEFTCEIVQEDGTVKVFTAGFVSAILLHIGKLHNYFPMAVYSESHFKDVLEKELGIKINMRFDW